VTDDERRRDIWRRSNGLPLLIFLHQEGRPPASVSGDDVTHRMAQAANADREREGDTE
jgi:hypothetical protein